MDKSVLHAIIMTPNICQIVLSFLKFKDSVSLMYVDSKFCNEIPNKIETLKVTSVPALLNINRTFPQVKKFVIEVSAYCRQKVDISASHFPNLKNVLFNVRNSIVVLFSDLVISAPIQKLELHVSMFSSYLMIRQFPETIRVLKLESNGSIVSKILELLPNLEDVDIYVNDTSKKCSLKFYQHSLRKIKCENSCDLPNNQSCMEIHSLEELEELRVSNFSVSVETHCKLSKLRVLQLENQTSSSSVDSFIGQTKFPRLNLYYVQYRKNEIAEDHKL